MTDLSRYYINGEWVAPLSAQSMTLINPATEEIYGSIPLAGISDVDKAVAAAASAADSFSRTSRDERLQLLHRLADIYERRMEDMAQAITLEMGATLKVSRGEQVESGIGHIRGFIDALEKSEAREILYNGDIQVREPIGVCGLITPWNWPMNQVSLKVGPVLATGSTCVLKPSEYTPLSSVLFTEMVHEAGYPPGVFNLIQGDGPTAGAALARHPEVRMVSFTGSTRAGVEVSRLAAQSVKRVTLELGGKSANLIFADCGDDLPERVREAVDQCFYNQGQSCDAPTRLLVERSCYKEVVELARVVGQALELGDPAQEGDHLGPLVNAVQLGRVSNLIEVGVSEGGTLLCGGPGKPEGRKKGYYVRPTILADVNNSMRIAREEVFGPVLVIIPFDSEEDAVRIANDSPYGLAAYVQTGSRERAERVASRLQAGAVHVNGTFLEYGSPFGGYKMSGNGREGGVPGLEDYQEVKTLHMPEAFRQ